MPISHAQERRNQAKKDAKAGVVKDVTGKAKKAPEQVVTCALCMLPLRVTKRNVEMVQHATAKHVGSTFEECWPGQTHVFRNVCHAPSHTKRQRAGACQG